jgi:hypothetical protein
VGDAQARSPHVEVRHVDFAWDELKLEYSKQEYDQLIENAGDAPQLSGDERTAVLEGLRAEQATALEDPDQEGKAEPPVVG